jgi:hypothetical protein
VVPEGSGALQKTANTVNVREINEKPNAALVRQTQLMVGISNSYSDAAYLLKIRTVIISRII